MTLHVELVSPEKILLSADAVMVVARTIGGGDIAFLTDHAPFIGALDTWPLEIKLTDDTYERVAVHGGFISVTDNQVKILSDLAELAGSIDVGRARAALAAAEAALPPGEEGKGTEAAAAVERARARLATAEGAPV
jgi:F-type H+-transporting ATPase subunit epsilon